MAQDSIELLDSRSCILHHGIKYTIRIVHTLSARVTRELAQPGDLTTGKWIHFYYLYSFIAQTECFIAQTHWNERNKREGVVSSCTEGINRGNKRLSLTLLISSALWIYAGFVCLKRIVFLDQTINNSHANSLRSSSL